MQPIVNQSQTVTSYMPRASSFYTNLQCRTLSKAFWKSK